LFRKFFRDEDTAVEEINICERVGSSEPDAHIRLARRLRQHILYMRRDTEQPILTLCIGTDRSTGDALGPLVGSQLKRSSIRNLVIMGCLDEPVHALNLENHIECIKEIPERPLVLAIDASLGSLDSVGQITLKRGPLYPGAGVNKTLPAVGDIHMTGIVNVKGFMDYIVLQNTRLSLVVKMASIVAASIQLATSDLS
jgi:putative sporulation protein YyaC